MRQPPSLQHPRGDEGRQALGQAHSEAMVKTTTAVAKTFAGSRNLYRQPARDGQDRSQGSR